MTPVWFREQCPWLRAWWPLFWQTSYCRCAIRLHVHSSGSNILTPATHSLCSQHFGQCEILPRDETVNADTKVKTQFKMAHQ